MNLPPPRSVYRRLLLPIYAPSLFSSISLQATLVLLPLYVLDKGSSAAFAALLIGLRGLGLLVFDLPVGVLLARLGDKPVLLGGLAAMTASTALFAFTDSPWLTGAAAFVSGLGFTAWMIGRQSYITDCSAVGERGRAISTMAGIMRFGGLIGPVAGTGAAHAFGYRVAFIALAASAGIAGLLVMIFAHNVRPERQSGSVHLARLRAIVAANPRVLVTAGIASIGLQLMRSARILLLPLFGHFLGLSIAAIGLVVSLAAIVDAALFYPVGLIMDRYGRKWVSVPCLVLSALSLALLPLTQGYYSLAAVALLAGVASGLGSGSLLTLGSDLAPANGSHEFLGLWRFIGDLGHAGGPMLIGALIELASLAAASTATAGIGLVSAAVMYWLVDETLRKD